MYILSPKDTIKMEKLTKYPSTLAPWLEPGASTTQMPK